MPSPLMPVDRKESCRVCGSPLLDDIVKIGNQYPSAVYPSPDEDYKDKLVSSSLNVTQCSSQDCSLVQLRYDTDLAFVFENYPYESGSTATMKEKLREVVTDALAHTQIGRKDIVLDIGGNDGTLLEFIQGPVRKRVNIDAAQNVSSVFESDNYLKINKSFDKDTYLDLDLPAPKLIFSIAMLYHLSDPEAFCREVAGIMNDDSMWCIQMTYLGTMLENNIYDNIVHEHLAYYSLQSLDYLLKKSGLKILDVHRTDSYGGSIRVFVSKNSSVKFQVQDDKLNSLKNAETKQELHTPLPLVRFNDRVQLLRLMTQELIHHLTRKSGPILALGASTKGNMICQFNGWGPEQISAVLDNSSKKIGLKMAGSDIPVVDEKEYFDRLSEYLLVLPFYYTDFFANLIRRKNSDKRKKFLISPIPYLKIREVYE